MSKVESAWDRVPGYRIDLVPCRARGRVSHGDQVLAEGDGCLVVLESDHEARLYFPEADVAWEHFQPTDHHTICPFKGEADYWNLVAVDPVMENVVWTYRDPFDEVAGLAGYVCFYHDRLAVQLEETWPTSPDRAVVHRFPPWGDAADLTRLMDVQPVDGGGFVAPPYPDPPLGQFLPGLVDQQQRLVVEGGQLLGAGIVAAAKTVPTQRVTSASMIFSKAAMFDERIDLAVEVLRGGRTFSTLETRISQAGKLRSAGIFLLDSGAPDMISGTVAMPDVGGPLDAEPLDMAVTGRELRVVDGAYRRSQEETGPPEIFTWARFRDAPEHDYLHAALLAQSTTHWTIAAALRPHEGITEAQAHITLSTGIMATSIAFHDEVDVSEWLLYANPAVYVGRGLAQGEGRVFTQEGKLVATYSVQAMIRGFDTDPSDMGKNFADAM